MPHRRMVMTIMGKQIFKKSQKRPQFISQGLSFEVVSNIGVLKKL
jgi:hypothetical protein